MTMPDINAIKLDSSQPPHNGSTSDTSTETQPNSASRPSDSPKRSFVTAPKRGQEQMLTAILRMQSDLFDHGKHRALESGALQIHEEDMAPLDSHASAIAREAHRDAFDPAQHAHDRLLDNEFQKNNSDRADAEQAVKFATATLREREEEAALAHPGEPPPKPSWALPAAAVAGIMITVAPTLHDFIFVMSDDFTSWLLSLLCGMFLGLLITLMILGDSDAGGHRTPTNWIGLGAGILMSLALGAIRLKGALCFGDYLFAFGLTVLELGIVLGLEGIAMTRRHRQNQWAVKKLASDQATSRLEMAKVHLTRWKDRVADLNEAINNHINYVEERAVRFLRIDEIQATATQAVRDGYRQGVAENRGRILGARGN